MVQVTFGDIILLKFPFSDGQSFKRRPASVIRDFNDEDIVVCRITSKIYTSEFDIFITDWNDSGLKLPSVIRVHKLATLEKKMIDSIIGQINESIKEKVKNIFTSLIE